MSRQIIYITQEGYRSAFRVDIESEVSKAVLVKLDDDRYKLKVGMVYFDEKMLSEEVVFDIAGANGNAISVEEGLFIDSIFTYFYRNHDLRNRSVFIVKEQELKEYLCKSLGLNGVDMMLKLKDLKHFYGVIRGIGVFKLLEVEQRKEELLIRLDYMQKVLNAILCEENCIDSKGVASYYELYS